jgi:hypothetical protein
MQTRIDQTLEADRTSETDATQTSTRFEKPRRRWGLTAAFVAFTLLAGLAAGFAFGRGGGDTVATDEVAASTTTATSTTLPAEPAAGYPDLSGFDHGSPLTAAQIDAVDQQQQQQADTPEATPQPAPQAPPEEPPAPAPAPAELVVPASIEVDGSGNGSFEISNPGDGDLDITSVTSGYPELTIGDVPTTVTGGGSATVDIEVDISGYPAGAYELGFQVNSSAGSAVVAVTGTKTFLIVLPLVADLDIPAAIVVPHNVPVMPLKITNNEDFDVTINLQSQHARLTAPAQATLVPGDNVVLLTIAPWAVNPANVMQMTLEVSWLLSSQEVTVIKHGQ